MLRVTEAVVTLALADSLNPSTVAPALFLAAGERPRRSLLEFVIAVFVVQLSGGLVITLGPGRLLLSVVPALGVAAKHSIEIGLGVAMTVTAGLLWRNRRKLGEKDLPDPNSQPKSSLLLAIPSSTRAANTSSIQARLTASARRGKNEALGITQSLLTTSRNPRAALEPPLERVATLAQKTWPDRRVFLPSKGS